MWPLYQGISPLLFFAIGSVTLWSERSDSGADKGTPLMLAHSLASFSQHPSQRHWQDGEDGEPEAIASKKQIDAHASLRLAPCLASCWALDGALLSSKSRCNVS